MRTMLDTNILVSMFKFPSKSMKFLEHELCMRHEIILSSYVIEELKDVVARKFPQKINALDVFLKSLPFTMAYTPEFFEISAFPFIRDVTDLPVLVTAILEDVDVLITRDKDFNDVDILKPEILTPSAFLDKYVK